jgi:hypothetical protein
MNVGSSFFTFYFPILAVLIPEYFVSGAAVLPNYEYTFSEEKSTVGSRAVLTCTAPRDDEIQHNFWQKRIGDSDSLDDVAMGGSPINGWKTRCVLQDFSQKLIILNVTLSDEGYYICTSDGGLGNKRTVVHLSVTDVSSVEIHRFILWSLWKGRTHLFRVN